MIKLENINIEFERKLVIDGEITINDGKITVITGDSGTGKTSLLYLIGLISTNTNYSYTFDGVTVPLDSDAMVSEFRKQKIGYVFQDNSLIDCLTIKDNIINAARIAGISITDSDVNRYLRAVHLSDVSMNVYPRVLSGGEQQRLAIACAMAKQPDLLIADEPTSSLDKVNSKIIMDILKTFAKSGKKVVIASHSDYVCKYADFIYNISNKKINLVKESALEVESPNRKKNNRNNVDIKYMATYATKAIRKGVIQKILLLILCGISIAFAANISSIGDGFVDYQNELIKKISDRKVFVINFTAPLQSYVDVDEHLSLSSDVIDKLHSINSIDTSYPFLEFRSVGYDYDKNDLYNSTTIIVSENEREKSYAFNSENNSDYSSVAIIPYYPEDLINDRIAVKFPISSDTSEGDIYLSHELSHLLNIDAKTDSPVKITLDMGIPVATTDVELSVSNVNSSYKADVDVSIVSTFEMDVAGVLDYDYKNEYSSSGNNIIYMPIDVMLDYLKAAQAKYAANKTSEDTDLNEWNPSSYVLYLKGYNDVKPAIKKIESIDPNLKATSAYQDVVSMNEMMGSIKSTATYVIIVVLLIVLILMTIIFINNTLNRKYEIAVLKANGLNKVEIFGIVISEALIHLLTTFMVSVLFALLIGGIINLFFSFDIIGFSIKTAVILLAISSIAIIAPTAGSLLIINSFKPDRIMRN